MPRLVLGRDFLTSYGQLPKDTQKKVDKFIDLFRNHTGAGISLEKPQAIADDRARTVRIDRFWRGVVAALGGARDTYVLFDVLPHDDAYVWCERNRFDVNPATGAFEVQDVRALDDFATAQESTAGEDRPLLAGIPDKHLTQLGIPETVIPLVRTLDSEEELEALAALLPETQADALLGLAAGMSPETIYAELVAGESPGAVDTEDLAAAAERPASSGMFYVVQSAEELQDVLNKPFDLWRVFLHPSQRRLAYRERFAGPAKVTGGAGTGKTVVAMHRAKYLAERLTSPGQQILLTTFTINLADNLRRSFRDLAGPAADRVEVDNVDAVAYRVIQEAEGKRPQIVTETESLWRQAAAAAGVAGLEPAFLEGEYENVILAQDHRDRQAYFKARRSGQGVSLDRRARAEVWAAVEAFEAQLRASGARTFLQLARDAADHLAASGPKYRHIVIDEAQDLHPLQWRMLRALAPEADNDLFLVGDSHQRIYDRRVSLRHLGIHVVGRSYRLRLNYRTTEEILRWSIGLLTGETFDDLDAGRDSLAGYRSAFHGPQPDVVGHTNRNDELAGLADAVQSWMNHGLSANDIGVAARTRRLAVEAAKRLRAAGLPTVDLREGGDDDGIRVGTMHRMKGLEFRAVAVAGADAGNVPLKYAICDAEADPVQHRRDLQRERCLLFVACTRARDMLHVSWAGEPSPFLLPHLVASS